MISRERGEDKLAAVRHFNIGNVVSRGAGPARFGPESKTFATLKRDAGEAVSLIVIVATCARIIAFQKLHHRRGARRVCRFSSDDLHQQTRGGVGRELVAVLAIWPTRHALATVCVFAERLLI